MPNKYRPKYKVRTFLWNSKLTPAENIEAIRREYVRLFTDPPGEIEIQNEEERHGLIIEKPI